MKVLYSMAVFAYFSLIGILVTSCQNKSKYAELDKRLAEYGTDLPNKFLKESKYAMFIVPLGSCDGCVKYLLDYSIEKRNKAGYKFIFCVQGFNDILLTSKFTSDQLNNANNIFIDEDGLFIKAGIGDSYYPMVAFVENDKIVDISKLEASTLAKQVKNVENFMKE